MRIGITSGDINGVGPEVILKALAGNEALYKHTIIIYGSGKVMAYHKNIIKDIDIQFSNASTAEHAGKGKVSVVNCWNEDIQITLGKPTPEAGQFAHVCLDRAVNDLKDGHIDVLVTAPINKSTMDPMSFPYPGHTEYLEHTLGAKSSLMTMIADDLRIALVTNHEPISKVPELLTKETVMRKINLFYHSLKRDFGKEKPTMAILGLNPHAGDDGKIGNEEQELIRPIIIELKKKGVLLFGPYSADGFFGSGNYTKFDGILAMYHDQGLIPFKTLSFGNGVNYTAGMDYVRTSPDHGTGYDIAGKNMADPRSMRNAIFAAVDIFNNRKLEFELKENQLVRSAPKGRSER
jgi:4-hydroxythreonine-4-phosphate dehydrogenase